MAAATDPLHYDLAPFPQLLAVSLSFLSVPISSIDAELHLMYNIQHCVLYKELKVLYVLSLNPDIQCCDSRFTPFPWFLRCRDGNVLMLSFFSLGMPLRLC